MSYFYFQNKIHGEPTTLEPNSLHTRFGAGFFTTLLYNTKTLCHLELHLERLFKSLEHFSISYQVVNFGSIIQELLERNQLKDRLARVNIFYGIYSFSKESTPLLCVAEFLPNSTPQCLSIYPNPHETFMSIHKSMSYFPYLLAKKHAQEHGFCDSILTNTKTEILETSTASLLFYKEGKFYTPKNEYILPSTALKLFKQQTPVTEITITPKDLPSFQCAYTLNSLHGMQAVQGINKCNFQLDIETCQKANTLILKQSPASHTCAAPFPEDPQAIQQTP
mgnify:CR=1 FL=1